jgi:hypothetical protein
MRSGLYNELLDKVEQLRFEAGTVTVKLLKTRRNIRGHPFWSRL